MMNLKLQNAAQRRFVFFECYVVKLKFQASSFDEISFFLTSLEGCVWSSVTKVDFQVPCLHVGGSREISEVQVRVCYYWQMLFSFT